MVKKGKLSLTEKYAIQHLLHKHKSCDDIASELDRSTTVINKYVNGELSRIHDTIANIKSIKPKPDKSVGNKKIVAKDLILNKTAGGKNTVAIMTQGASERGDNLIANVGGRATRVFDKNVCRLDSGEEIKYGEEIVKEQQGPRTKNEVNKIKNMLSKGKSVNQIASILHRDVNLVQKWIYELEE